eukprot:1160893-Pelagomonas_calceolata.AAC.1
MAWPSAHAAAAAKATGASPTAAACLEAHLCRWRGRAACWVPLVGTQATSATAALTAAMQAR